jgi:hypothetical protein
MRILFLDIDGVLNTGAYIERAIWTPPLASEDDHRIIDPAAVAILNTVLEATGALVVVSSTWRIAHPLEALRRMLERRGFTGTVLDVTPQLTGRNKGREITTWLAAQGDNVEGFAIVDDDDEAGAEFPSHFLRTTFDVGLTIEHVAHLVHILRSQRP